MIRRGAIVAGLLLVATGGRADGQAARPAPMELVQLRVVSDAAELVALRTAPVRYRTLEQLMLEIERPLPARSAPIVVTRTSPRQIIDYVLCVTRDGTLVVGQQVRTLDEAQGRYVFTRGEIARGYPPLDGSERWAWLMEVPLDRATTVVLELRSFTRWPVDTVAITASRQP